MENQLKREYRKCKGSTVGKRKREGKKKTTKEEVIGGREAERRRTWHPELQRRIVDIP